MSGYRHDVFVSYARYGDTAKLAQSLFVPMLRDCLHDRVGTAKEDAVFLDEHDSANGSTEEDRICGALRAAKVMVVLVDKRYWHRAWCRREWATFLQRERIVGRRAIGGGGPALIYPIWAIEQFSLPVEADGTMVTKSLAPFRKLVCRTTPRPTPKLYEFVDTVAAHLAEWVASAPPYDDSWPIEPLGENVPGLRPSVGP